MRTYGDKLSVTSILNICGYYPQIIYATEADRDFGTLIHQQCALHAEGKELTISNEFSLAYVKQFGLWLKNYTVFAIEKQIIGGHYGGTLDLIVGDKRNVLWIVDLKTSGADCRAYQLQTAGYQMLANESKIYFPKVRRRGVLLLSAEGYKFIEHKNEMDSYIFRACVNVANDLVQNKIVKIEEE